jgi:hypothetical protein
MEPDQAHAVRDESSYWLEVIDEIGGLNKQAEALCSDIANATVALLSLISLTDNRANAFVRDGLDHTNAALARIMAMQDHFMAVLEVANRRHAALRAQVAGE